jgi:hypothetical protein
MIFNNRIYWNAQQHYKYANSIFRRWSFTANGVHNITGSLQFWAARLFLALIPYSIVQAVELTEKEGALALKTTIELQKNIGGTY